MRYSSSPSKFAFFLSHHFCWTRETNQLCLISFPISQEAELGTGDGTRTPAVYEITLSTFTHFNNSVPQADTFFRLYMSPFYFAYPDSSSAGSKPAESAPNWQCQHYSSQAVWNSTFTFQSCSRCWSIRLNSIFFPITQMNLHEQKNASENKVDGGSPNCNYSLTSFF